MPDETRFINLFLPIQGNLQRYVLSRGVPVSEMDDLVQNAALIMVKKFDSFQGGPGSPFMAWAFAILNVEVAIYFKSRSRLPLRLTEEAIQDFEKLSSDGLEVPVLGLESLKACLGQLTDKSRLIVRRRYGENTDIGSIAREFGQPVVSIYKSLVRIRKMLQDCIERRERAREV